MKKSMVLAILVLVLAGTGWAQSGYDDFEINGSLIFPHLALGGGYQMTVILMNLGTADSVSGTLHFLKQDGTPMEVIHELSLVSDIDITLAPGEIRYVLIASLSPEIMAGWAIYEMSGSHPLVYGSMIFAFLVDQNVVAQVGVTGSRYEFGQFMRIIAPVMVSASTNTGLALVNTSDRSMDLTATLYGGSTAPLAQNEFSLAPGNQIAQFITNFFPGQAWGEVFYGLVEVETDRDGMVGLALLQSDGVLTSVPVIPLPRTIGD